MALLQAFTGINMQGDKQTRKQVYSLFDRGYTEKDVKAVIARDVPITIADEDHIRIGDEVIECTGVRTHVTSSGQIESFRLLPELRYNPIDQEHLLVGIVGAEQEETGFDRILKIVG